MIDICSFLFAVLIHWIPYSHLILQFLRRSWDGVYEISWFFCSLICKATRTWSYSSALSCMLLLWWIPDFFLTWLTGRAFTIWNYITTFLRCLFEGYIHTEIATCYWRGFTLSHSSKVLTSRLTWWHGAHERRYNYVWYWIARFYSSRVLDFKNIE